MRTNLKTTYSQFLEEQPELQSIIKEMLEEASENISDDMHPNLEEIECHSRDGFIRDSENFGGFTATTFDFLSSYWGSGLRYSSKLANKHLDKSVEYSLESAKENFIDQYAAELGALEINEDQVNYHDLYELKQSYLAEKLSEFELESMNDDTIMLQIRVMYNGSENGKHSAEVSSVINWESPYHRSSGAVYRNCGFRMETEDVKVVNIEWKNNTELKTKLAKALKKVKEIF